MIDRMQLVSSSQDLQPDRVRDKIEPGASSSGPVGNFLGSVEHRGAGGLERPEPSLKPLTWLQRRMRKILFRGAKRMRGGCLVVRDADGEHRLGEVHSLSCCELTVHDPALYRRMLFGGALGAAESLMDGQWTAYDLTGVVRLFVRNLDVLDGFDRGWGSWRGGLERLRHWWRGNTRRNARANIRAHYDLGNPFFQLFLDPTMNYSSALFSNLASGQPGESLHRAQLNKMERLCQQLDLRPGQHLLEIGTGWGSLACYAARHYGCRVTTTTISAEQYQWSCERVRQEGLEPLVTVLDQDYRHLTGQYDRIVSVEMIEAVGDRYYDVFFAKCRELLRDDGLLLLQSITIVDQRYRQHLRNVDFICKYIFPGGSLPCISRLTQSAADAGAMRLVQLADFAPHYAETLRRWRGRFHQHAAGIRALGYDERFRRMWDYYLAYCEAAFEERQINLVHMLFAMKQSRIDPLTLADFPGSLASRPPVPREPRREEMGRET
jgi:cyclopropane-fatty-acyl-phospholipid synthase